MSRAEEREGKAGQQREADAKVGEGDLISCHSGWWLLVCQLV